MHWPKAIESATNYALDNISNIDNEASGRRSHPGVTSIQEPDKNGVLSIRFWVAAQDSSEEVSGD
jgi:hypothetical protein